MDWIRWRIEDARNSRATELDLGVGYNARPSDRLTELPPEICDLTWLESLDLSGHDLTGLPLRIERLERLAKLNLSRNERIAVNGALERLPALREVDVSWTSGTAVHGIAWDRLTQLEGVKLGGVTLPPGLECLAGLRRLDLWSLEVVSGLDASVWPCLEALALNPGSGLVLPPTLKTLTLYRGTKHAVARLPEALENLAISDKESVDPAALRGHRRLSSLQIHCFGEKAASPYPALVPTLPALRSLRIMYDSVAPIDRDALLARPWIELDLDGVPLGRFPQQLLDQSGLERLALTDAGITEVSPEIGRLTGLRMLNLSGNPLTALPPEIAALTRLEDLRLATTKLTALPEAVARLPALRRLDLDATKISSLPEGIGRLTALEHLGIRGTPITRLPRALTALRRLKPVDLTDVRLTDPPPEIAAEGWAAIQRYRAALDEQGETRLFEAKLVIVGEGTVGKTSLMRKLMDRAAPLASGDESHDSTRGINIVAWHLPTCKSDDFRVNVWDFGGQQIYHSTHQFFLTRRTLYLFVWDAVIEDRAEGFEYWLNVVRTLSGGSPVLMVMNKSDKRSKPIDQDGLRRSFPDIAGFHQVSAKTGAGLDDLQNAIRQHIADLPLVGTPWPNRWTALRAAVEADPRDYIDRAEYLRLCEAQGIAAADADILSGFLHDLGVILHFRDDPLLGNTVILKPRWGTDAVYAVLDSEKVRDDHGRFRNSDLGAIWDPTRHPAAKHPELLRLMERFEQCFPLEGGGNRYIVPELLSPGAPNIRWKDKGALVFEYHYTFMPAGIITRFICRTHRLIEDELFWRRGVVLTREGARARVESFPSERTIRIAIHGKTARELLAVIRDHFTHIHQTLNNLAVRQNLPCPCGECAGAEKQHFFDYDDIRRVMEKRDTVPCMISGDDVAIADLLGILGDEARRPGKPAAPPRPIRNRPR